MPPTPGAYIISGPTQIGTTDKLNTLLGNTHIDQTLDVTGATKLYDVLTRAHTSTRRAGSKENL